MFATILSPESLDPNELDRLLANGWYRMGQNIFTTHFLCFNNCFYSAVWLRVSIKNDIEDAKFKKLKKQNKLFTTEIKKAEITNLHEALYKNYRQSVSFDPSETLQSLLYGYNTNNRFNTYEINVYDKEVLIASGYFDLGNESAAGIVSFYHPEYKKYSLGKYLIYSKINFCKQQNISYFYPGYVVPGYPPFDYKLDIGKATLQYFSVFTQQWFPYHSFSAEKSPLDVMLRKLEVIQSMLIEKNFSTNMLYYRFFDANLDPYYSTDKLFDYPVFLHTRPLTDEAITRLIVYDIVSNNYCLIQCSSVIKTDWYKHVENIYSAHLLKFVKVLLYARTPEDFVTLFSRKYKSIIH